MLFVAPAASRTPRAVPASRAIRRALRVLRVLLFRRTTSRWSPAAGHTKSTDAARVVRRVFLHVVADVPDRAVVARVDGGLRVVLPPQRIRLRCLAFHEDRLVQGESPLRVVRETAG